MRMNTLVSGAFLFLTSFSIAADTQVMAETPTQVKLKTSLGDIVIQMNSEKAPISSRNFIHYVKEGFYDGTIFHRVIPGFMAQGGGFAMDFTQKVAKAPIRNEADNGLTNDRGTVAMARTSDPHSASSQFFINYKNNDFLNYKSQTPQGWGYTVFGKVVEGMEVVDQMAKIPTENRGIHQDVPETDIVIERAVVISE